MIDLFKLLIIFAIYGKLWNPYALYLSLNLVSLSKVIDLLIVHVSILFFVSLDLSHYIEKSFDQDHPEIEHEIYHVYLTAIVCAIAIFQSKSEYLQIMNIPFRKSILIGVLITLAHIMAVLLQESSVFILVLGLMGYISVNFLEKIFDVLLNRIHSFHPIHDQIQHQIRLFSSQFQSAVKLSHINRYDIDKVKATLIVEGLNNQHTQHFNKLLKVGDIQLEIDIVNSNKRDLL